jgi:hypothetical protein
VNAADLTAALGGRWHGRYGLARCPAHNDRTPSLSIGEGKDGKLLVKCWGGCVQQQVIDALRRAGLWTGHAGAAAVPTGAQRQAQRERDAEHERDRQRRDVFVEKIWQETWTACIPPRDSPIELWLLARRIDSRKLDLDGSYPQFST